MRSGLNKYLKKLGILVLFFAHACFAPDFTIPVYKGMQKTTPLTFGVEGLLNKDGHIDLEVDNFKGSLEIVGVPGSNLGITVTHVHLSDDDYKNNPLKIEVDRQTGKVSIMVNYRMVDRSFAIDPESLRSTVEANKTDRDLFFIPIARDTLFVPDEEETKQRSRLLVFGKHPIYPKDLIPGIEKTKFHGPTGRVRLRIEVPETLTKDITFRTSIGKLEIKNLGGNGTIPDRTVRFISDFGTVSFEKDWKGLLSKIKNPITRGINCPYELAVAGGTRYPKSLVEPIHHD